MNFKKIGITGAIGFVVMGVIGGIIFKRFDMFILLAFFSSLGFALVYYVHKGKK